jgi:membrane-associated phospholipid phosphatase
MYVGAHLPLDAVGGIALGVAIGATSRRFWGGRRSLLAPTFARDHS